MASEHRDPKHAKVLVCGGAVVDCIVKPENPAQRGASRTSMPGRAQVSEGGVGRNIAEAIARLGGRPRLLSAVGADPAGERLRASAQGMGIEATDIAQVPSARTATFTALLDGTGELVGAVADMAIFDQISPAFVDAAAGRGAFEGAALVVCDANLSAQTLERARVRSAKASVPAWFEPVSVAKAPHGLGGGGPWHLVSPNWDELRALLRMPPAHEPMPGALAGRLPDEILRALDQAEAASIAKNVLLTMGAQGVVLAECGGPGETSAPVATIHHMRYDLNTEVLVEGVAGAPLPGVMTTLLVDVERLPASPRGGRRLWYRLLRPLDRVVDSTGAGDALLAGAARAFSAGWPLEKAVIAGLVCAHLTLFAEGAVAPYLHEGLLDRLAVQLSGLPVRLPASKF